LARGFLLGPVADAIKLPTLLVGRDHRGEPADGRLRERGQQPAQPFGLFGRLMGEAAGTSSSRVVADVLVYAAREPLFEQETMIVVGEKVKRARGEVNDVASFEAFRQTVHVGLLSQFRCPEGVLASNQAPSLYPRPEPEIKGTLRGEA